eukprot:1133334-Prorocentrum_minimum.AAC.1
MQRECRGAPAGCYNTGVVTILGLLQHWGCYIGGFTLGLLQHWDCYIGGFTLGLLQHWGCYNTWDVTLGVLHWGCYKNGAVTLVQVKLSWMNGMHLRALPAEEQNKMIGAHLQACGVLKVRLGKAGKFLPKTGEFLPKTGEFARAACTHTMRIGDTHYLLVMPRVIACPETLDAVTTEP